MFKFSMHCPDPRGFHRGDRRGRRDDRFAGEYAEGHQGFFPGGHHGRFGGPRGPFGEGFGPFGKGRGGFGGGRERLFDSGVMRLVILRELAQESAYGYQLIKRLEERMAGGYRPSAGVIYPTLTMLEEQGFTVAAVNEAGKKVYSVTDEGKAFLKENQERLNELEHLMKAAGRGFARGRSPEIMEAMGALREAIGDRIRREDSTPEQISKVAELLQNAAKAIREI